MSEKLDEDMVVRYSDRSAPFPFETPFQIPHEIARFRNTAFLVGLTLIPPCRNQDDSGTPEATRWTAISHHSLNHRYPLENLCRDENRHWKIDSRRFERLHLGLAVGIKPVECRNNHSDMESMLLFFNDCLRNQNRTLRGYRTEIQKRDSSHI